MYSPLHGTGNIPARRVLQELGFEHVYVVKEQELPDGEFPTVSYPNPEAGRGVCPWIKSLRRKWMQIWYLQQTRMLTVLVFM